MKKTSFVVSVMAFLMVSIFLSTNVLAEEITIRGTVNDKYQIVSEDGQIYEVAESEKGDEVVLQNIGKIVKISGTVEQLKRAMREIKSLLLSHMKLKLKLKLKNNNLR